MTRDDSGAALAGWASGVAVVTVRDGRDDVGATVSAFCPVSEEPPIVAVSLLSGSYLAEVLGRQDAFAVTILSERQRVLAGRFAAAGRPSARRLLDGVEHVRGSRSGSLIPASGVAAIDCAVRQRLPAGDHLLLIADVAAAVYVDDAAAPLLRFRGRYPLLARGEDPPSSTGHLGVSGP
ncbi:MAG TPA: flavin reductase family protein [Streptosporangiaceae bacterium]|nr:flavin reductase family protein [Streptosporangiaceae bacterium]